MSRVRKGHQLFNYGCGGDFLGGTPPWSNGIIELEVNRQKV
jgi:hypothetical protein